MLNKILIVEDEQALSSALDIKLAKAGYETTVVTDGFEAIAAAKANDYSLILLDLIMPKMDGFKALDQIRALGKQVNVIVLSNLSQQSDITRVKRLGISGYYIKSNTPIFEIVQRVRELTV